MAHDIMRNPVTGDFCVANFAGQPAMWHRLETIASSKDDVKNIIFANSYHMIEVAELQAALTTGNIATGKFLVVENDGLGNLIQHCESPNREYNLLHPSEVVELGYTTVDAIQADGRFAEMASAMRLNGGRGIVWSIDLGTVDFGGGDSGHYYLNFETGSDRKTRVWVSIIRSVCANTVAAGKADAGILGRIADLELNNRGGTRLVGDDGVSILDTARKIIDNVSAWVHAYETRMKRLKMVDLPQGEEFSRLLKITGLETGALKLTNPRGRKAKNAPSTDEPMDPIALTDEVLAMLQSGGNDTRSLADGAYGVAGRNLIAAYGETLGESHLGVDAIIGTGFGLVQAFSRVGSRKGDGSEPNRLYTDWGNAVEAELLKRPERSANTLVTV